MNNVKLNSSTCTLYNCTKCNTLYIVPYVCHLYDIKCNCGLLAGEMNKFNFVVRFERIKTNISLRMIYETMSNHIFLLRVNPVKITIKEKLKYKIKKTLKKIKGVLNG